MTLARPILKSGSFIAPAPPAPVAFILTSAPNGGNNPWQIPGAFYRAGFTYLSWVDGSGNIECASWDHATETLSAITTIHAGFQADAHSSPSILRRASDGRFLALYSLHNAGTINMRISTNPDDITAWGAATNLDSQLVATRYTDEQIYEFGSTLYMLFRDEPNAGTDSRWCVSTCSSASPTSGWAAATRVYQVTAARSYVISCEDQANGKIHFIATNSTSSGGPTKLGYFYLDVSAGTYHDGAGTPLTVPFDFTEITEVYSGSGVVYASNMTVDASGYPVVCAQDTIAGDIRYIYVRFNGTTWSSTNVVSAGTGYEYSGTGTGFGAWGNAVDDGNPNDLWLLIGSGQAELWRYRTADGGATFTGLQITSGSSAELTQVICVRGPGAGLRAFYQSGTWTTYTNWSQGLIGVG